MPSPGRASGARGTSSSRGGASVSIPIPRRLDRRKLRETGPSGGSPRAFSPRSGGARRAVQHGARLGYLSVPTCEPRSIMSEESVHLVEVHLTRSARRSAGPSSAAPARTSPSAPQGGRASITGSTRHRRGAPRHARLSGRIGRRLPDRHARRGPARAASTASGDRLTADATGEVVVDPDGVLRLRRIGIVYHLQADESQRAAAERRTRTTPRLPQRPVRGRARSRSSRSSTWSPARPAPAG